MAKKAKAPLDPLKAKEQRQKKMLIVLAPVFLLVLVLMVPKTLKRLHASSAAPPAPPATTTSTTTPTPTPGLATPFGAALIGATTTVTGGLSGDAPATAAVGQLASLGRFASKDPFAGPIVLPGSTTPTTPSGPSGNGGNGGGNGGNGSTTPPPTPPTPPVPTPTSAVIKVNGIAGEVTVGGDFPQASSVDPTLQPIFHLVSLDQRTAKISIVGGTYASGASTLTISVGKPITLMNKADGSRFTIELMPQGTTVPTTTGTDATTPAPAAPTTSTTPSTSTTVTTVTTVTATTTTTGATTTGGP
jgi:hypothetical protein